MQSTQIVAWAEKYRPTTTATLLGNEEAVSAFKTWLESWAPKRKLPKAKACLLVGPPGVGKTTLARAAANDFHFQVVEMNASDVRTEKAIRNMLAPASTSATLGSFAKENRGNLILLDEVDGVFGREDRGGLGAILSIISDSPVPIVLTANNIDDERFDNLRKASIVAELFPIRPRLLVSLINHMLAVERLSIPSKTVKEIARLSHGDLRAAINDTQALATSGTVTISPKRTRELSEKETVTGLFASGEIRQARWVLNETELPLYRDELVLLLHDLLPYIYISPTKLAQAYGALSLADIAYGKVGAGRSRAMMPPPFNMPRRDTVPEWSLLPNALNELASVGIQPADNDIEHALEVAPRVSLKVVDRYQYRLWTVDRLCSRVAKACHLSKRKARREIVPFLIAIFAADAERGRQIAVSLDLEERDIEFLLSESRMKPSPTGPEQVLDPTGFRLPYMGKDKFIQLMRIGLTYDRDSGKFAVRRLDNLDSLEERLTEILSKPVKFKHPEQVGEGIAGEIIKECYVDGRKILCAECEFIDDCPTHTIEALKFCLCDETHADPKGYDKYVAKNRIVPKPPKRASSRKKKN